VWAAVSDGVFGLCQQLGKLAVSLPARADLGMAVLAIVMLAWLIWVLRSSRGRIAARSTDVVQR